MSKFISTFIWIKLLKFIEVSLSKLHWQILANERTGMKWLDIFTTYYGMVEKTCIKFQN